MKESNSMRIKCPTTNLTKNERITDLFNQFNSWIDSPNLTKLLEDYGLEVPNGLSFPEKVKLINNFVNEHWDFRRNRGERWNLYDENFTKNKKELIVSTAKELGLFEIADSLSDFNYVLILGGAGKSNIDRPVLAKKVIDNKNMEECSIVALSGKRPINKAELPYLEGFAKNANTEFDALTQGVLKVFKVSNSEFNSKFEENINQNLSWEIREYSNNYPIYSLAVPSSDPARRANSRDTFKFFLDKFNIDKEDKVLLVTSNIYVPYQLLSFIDLALDKGFDVDCIGSPPQNYLANYSNYLQEIKATINQIYRLINKYSDVQLENKS